MSRKTQTHTETTPGTLVSLNPRALVVGANVRTDSRLDPALVESVRERGVLEPIVAYADEDGTHVVLMGQRRTLAACEAGRESVPVVLVPKPAETDRLVDQLAENDHRTGVREVERIAAMGQMALLGMSAAQIAKQTAHKKAAVEQALAIAKAPAALDRLADESLTIDQALILAEFDGDEDATAQLLAAGCWGMTHTAQRIRTDRTRAALLAAETERQAAAGVRIITDDDEDAHRLHILTDQDGQALDPTEHATTCPGHGVYIDVHHADVYVDPATGEPAPDQDAAAQAMHDAEAAYLDSLDEDEDEDDMPEPHYRTEYRMIARTQAGCLAPKAFGHTIDAGHLPATGEQDAATKEAERAERRRVRTNNGAWDAAEVVRREWLTTFAKRKTAPKGAAAYLAAAVAYDTHALADVKRYDLVAELLGVKRAAYGPSAGIREQIDKATEGRALHLALVQALAAHEATMSRHTWRHADAMDRRYLAALESWGYTLSDVEAETRSTKK